MEVWWELCLVKLAVESMGEFGAEVVDKTGFFLEELVVGGLG